MQSYTPPTSPPPNSTGLVISHVLTKAELIELKVGEFADETKLLLENDDNETISETISKFNIKSLLNVWDNLLFAECTGSVMNIIYAKIPNHIGLSLQDCLIYLLILARKPGLSLPMSAFGDHSALIRFCLFLESNALLLIIVQCMGQDYNAIAKWGVEILNYHISQLNHTMVLDFLRYISITYDVSEEDLHQLLIINRRPIGPFTLEEFIQISLALNIKHPTLLKMSEE